jgi:hypothetical protein
MLRRIALLYPIEKTVRGKQAALRLAARREHPAPIIAARKPWPEAQLARIPQQSRLAEDIRHTLAHWPGLIRFLHDGSLELDTNPVENRIGPIALTRKMRSSQARRSAPRTGPCAPRRSPHARCRA